MGLEDLIIPLAASVAGAGIAVGLAWALSSRWHVSVPPNQAMVLFGRCSVPSPANARAGPNPVEVRRPRVVVGGSAFVPPWNHGVGYLSLGPVDLDLNVRSMHAVEGGPAAGWEARIHVQAKIPAESTTLLSAAENLLGKTEDEVRLVVRHAVEGAVPAVLTRLRPTESEPDWERLAAEIEAAVAPDLIAAGLVVRNLSITGLHGIASPEVSAQAPPTRSSLPRSTLALAPDGASSGSGLELRVARVERSLGIMGAEIVRIAREDRDDPEVYHSFSVFDLALGDEPPLAALAPSSEEDVVHDSMGGDRPARSRRTSNEDAAGEGRRDPRPLLDSEPLR